MRLQALEEKSERALAEILATQEAVRVVESKLDVMNKELLSVRAEQNRFNARLEEVERRPS